MYPRILEPRQVNLSNLEAYSEPYKVSKMEFFAEIVLILDVWLDSEYASVICYSLYGKTEDSNRMDSVAMQIYWF